MPFNPRSLPGRSVLVIAPHPDDESLGCGGLLSCLAAHGRTIHVVFVTDGSASHKGSPTWSRARLAARRESEACNALRYLGLGRQPHTFLRLPDSGMPTPSSPGYREACRTIAAIAADLKPGLALLPWRRDPHCDHRASWRLASDAIAAAGQSPMILEYAVWLGELGGEGDAPHPGEARSVAFDIRPAMAAKRAAIGAHRSQTTDLIGDAAIAFRLSAATIARLSGPSESYWAPQ